MDDTQLHLGQAKSRIVTPQEFRDVTVVSEHGVNTSYTLAWAQTDVQMHRDI